MGRPSVIPKYRKHSSGNARVTINGRDYLLGPWNSRTSIREYDRIVAEFLSTGRSPSFGVEAEVYTVTMLIRDYLRHSKAYYGTQTGSEYHSIRSMMKTLRDLYADHDAAGFGPVGFKAVREMLLTRGTLRPGPRREMTRQGANKQMKRVLRAFKWAAGEGKIPATVFETLRLVPSLKYGHTTAPDTKPIVPVEDTVVEITLTALAPIVADMVKLQRLIGCRPSEVCGLTPASFDRSDSSVWVAKLVEHKTAHHGHTRKLYVGPEAQAILTPYLDRESDLAMFRPCEAVAMKRAAAREARTTPLSCGNIPGRRSGGLAGRKARKGPGDAYTTNSYRRAIHNACDVAFPAPGVLGRGEGETKSAWMKRLTETQLTELKVWQADHRWSPNRLRHAKGTEVRKTLGLEAAQVTLGHRNADVTQIYAQRDEELAKRVALSAG